MKSKIVKKYLDNEYNKVLNNTDFEVLNYDEYIKISNNYFNEKIDELFVHSRFILSKDKFVHEVEELDLIEKRIMLRNEFNNNDEFKNNLLFPLIKDYMKKNKIRDVQMIPNSNNTSLYNLSIFAINENILSIEKISKTFAREIVRKINELKKEEYVDKNNYESVSYMNVLQFVLIIVVITIICGMILASLIV